jgi:aspartate 1-decarboxylase
MFRSFMRSKIHQARVTDANLNYVGSITIDEAIMDAVGIRENEKVQVVNNNNGERIETYVIRGERGSKVICLNGAAARRFQVGDTVIIIAYGLVTEAEIEFHQPKIAILNENNEIIEKRSGEIAGTMVSSR